MRKRFKFKNFTLYIDEKRAREVFAVLEEYWLAKKGIFKKVILPQDRYQINFANPIEQASYLFFAAIPMRGGINSDGPFRWMKYLYDNFPELFDAKKASCQTEKHITEALRVATNELLEGSGNGNNGAGVMGYKLVEHAASWIKNAKTLADEWRGNPLNIFEGTANFEEAFARVDRRKSKHRQIFGMRRKIFSLYAIWLLEKNLLDDYVQDSQNYPTPIPIDFHAMRIFWTNQIIEFNKEAVVPLKKKYPDAIIGRPGVRVSEKLMDVLALWSDEFV